jgi:hypothetical protein
MPKNVVLKRITTLKLEDSNGEPQIYRYGDPLVVSDEFYKAHEDWFDVIEDMPPDLSSMTNDELRELLRDRDLKTSGTKSELIDRLRGQ